MNFKIVRYHLLLAFLLVAIHGIAQQGIIMKPLETDSAQMELERQMEYRQLISGASQSNLLTEKITLPGFNDLLAMNNPYSINFDFSAIKNFAFTGISAGTNTTYYNPYFHNGVVLSEGAYKLGNKFTFGGFSYGANSVFSAPLPNQSFGKFDSYGSTIFMQYNVSKKVKIQTRVNVSQGHYPEF